MKGGSILDNIIGKIQRLNTVFSKSSTTLISIDALCDELCGIIGCNIYLFNTKGKIFTYSVAEKFDCAYTKCSLENAELPQYYMDFFNKNNVSITDMYEEHPKCTYQGVKQCLFNNRYYSMYPIFSAFKKVAGILFIKYEDPFSESDNVLCEYTCAIISIEMLRQEQEKIHQLSMEAAKAKLAVDSLTFSEKKAARAILKEIKGDTGEVFLNSIASKTYTTPSTVSSALKKLELSTLITTKTRGVKGKCIKILNQNLRNELDECERNPRINSNNSNFY
jgi:transcriptional pleiotropic repressor